MSAANGNGQLLQVWQMGNCPNLTGLPSWEITRIDTRRQLDIALEDVRNRPESVPLAILLGTTWSGEEEAANEVVSKMLHLKHNANILLLPLSGNEEEDRTIIKALHNWDDFYRMEYGHDGLASFGLIIPELKRVTLVIGLS